MPEIAEVETVRRVLKKQILNKKIKDVNVLYPNMIESDLFEFKNKLVGNEFLDIKRRGKWLIFELHDYYLLSHLRMEGKYFIKNSNDPIEKHEHIIFNLEDNTDLRYHDTRKFGRMNLVEKDELEEVEAIKKQGAEPNSVLLTKDYLYSKIHDKKVPMKTLMLDQTIISGLGNIYADELLFWSNISPLRLGCDVTLDECKRIVCDATCLINCAIEHGGTTIRSYTSSLGVTGTYQNYLKVHKREGVQCDCCEEYIKKIKVGGRSTYYCPNCQK